MISLGFCNSITNNVVKEKIDYYIDFFIAKHSTSNVIIEKVLVLAIFQQESQMKPYCRRFELDKWNNKEYRSKVPRKYRDDTYAYTSMGIGQIMFMTARDRGYRRCPDDLLIEKYSIEYSIKHIKWLIKRYWDIKKVISSYNQGSPKCYYKYMNTKGEIVKDKFLKADKMKKKKYIENLGSTGIFLNQYTYVNPVLKYYKKFGGQIKIK
jgi:hypothetical protein